MKKGFIALVSCLVLWGAVAMARKKEPQFTTDFRLDDCRFKATGENTFFILKPGSLVLEGEEDDETVRVVITVLDEFEGIFVPGLGVVRTRVIEERESIDDRLVEISRNFFAICEGTNDVFYFGEDVDIFNPDGTVTHQGAWRAGEPDGDGFAEPGIIMPGRFLLGSRYFQELADGIALDGAEHVEMGLRITTAAGSFQDCVRILETTPLEPREQSEKIYCPGIGLVFDDGLELVESSFGSEDD